jgi:hypothetical protein
MEGSLKKRTFGGRDHWRLKEEGKLGKNMKTT